MLISRVEVDYIDLSSLRLIRGIQKYSRNHDTCNAKKDGEYALFVHSNQVASGSVNGYGLKELWLPKLTGN